MSQVAKPERVHSNMRGVRYGEVLAVFLREEGLVAEVFGTQLINDCPQDLWDTLNADDIAKEMGAVFVKLNGPRYWCLDAFGSKVAVVEPVFRDFNGLTMRRIATVELGNDPSPKFYAERHVNRGAVFFFDAGSEVHELVNPDGLAYIMQAYCVAVDPALNAENLKDVGARLKMPEGWSFRTRILDEEIVVDTSGTRATVLQDELENSYTLPV
ncbi:hypothetical protein HQ459_00435 [bacterium]|nr:hypothetical protein [bacterium]